jgi:diamine N-acetyltransferase
MKTKPEPTRESRVSLREITSETVRAICNLQVRPDQNRFVAPVSVSIAQAYFEPKAWFRAIYADETPVGFVMVYRDGDEAEYFLWRYLIDARYQRMGFGKQAMARLIDEVRTWPGAVELLVSYVPDADGPGPFYKRLGFEPTGEMEGIDEVARLALD